MIIKNKYKKFINLDKSYWIIKKYYVDPNEMVKFLIKLLTFIEAL